MKRWHRRTPIVEKASGKGHVYILTNKGYAPNLLKIGMTTRTPEARAREMFEGSTGVPYPFNVAFSHHVSDCERAEILVHAKLHERRAVHYREFFEVDLNIAIQVIKEVCAEVDGVLVQERRRPTRDERRRAQQYAIDTLRAESSRAQDAPSNAPAGRAAAPQVPAKVTAPHGQPAVQSPAIDVPKQKANRDWSYFTSLGIGGFLALLAFVFGGNRPSTGSAPALPTAPTSAPETSYVAAQQPAVTTVQFENTAPAAPKKKPAAAHKSGDRRNCLTLQSLDEIARCAQ